MPAELKPRIFDAACLPDLAAFDCGQDRFGRIATEWIRCSNAGDCALQAMADRSTEVFLYYTTDGTQVVGFGSLGQTVRTIRGSRETWSIIPHVGIDVRFHGHPVGSRWEDRYSTGIMVDLMAIARDHNTPTLMLKVHVDNGRAFSLYKRLGFQEIGRPNDRGYRTMTIENCD